jgi:hypothetical protein
MRASPYSEDGDMTALPSNRYRVVDPIPLDEAYQESDLSGDRFHRSR